MDELWGEVRPLPEDRLEVLEGGEELEAAGGVLAAHYTPGHAYHHLAYLDPSSGAFFTGDVGGIRQIGPQSLYLTHFGRFDDTDRHLAELEQRLQDWVLFVGERMDSGMRSPANSRPKATPRCSPKAQVPGNQSITTWPATTRLW